MAKAKEPKTTSTRAAKPAASRTTSASSRPAKVPPAAPAAGGMQGSAVIQTGVSSGGNGGGSRAQMSPEEVYRLIQETAYYKAKARGFAPGHEVQDWIEAEAEVRMRLDSRA
jgi:hypothetical protein